MCVGGVGSVAEGRVRIGADCCRIVVYHAEGQSLSEKVPTLYQNYTQDLATDCLNCPII